jgi:hypothetical protein
MPLRLVHPAPASPVEAIKKRVRAMVKPSGMLQCNRCASRTAVTVINGAVISKGRIQGGTVIENLVCDNCRKAGVIVPMLPSLKRVE